MAMGGVMFSYVAYSVCLATASTEHADALAYGI
jgi:hypothetical protein